MYPVYHRTPAFQRRHTRAAWYQKILRRLYSQSQIPLPGFRENHSQPFPAEIADPIRRHLSRRRAPELRRSPVKIQYRTQAPRR